MGYHTVFYLLLFLPLSLLAYQVMPKKWRGYTLIGCSYLFFWLVSRGLLIFLIGTTLFTHHIGIWLETQKENRKKILFFGIITLLMTLVFMKYQPFIRQNLEVLFSMSEGSMTKGMNHLLVPIGISFYTLQAVGYLADVYWGKIHADFSLEKTALFLSFFPQIMEGPICRYSDTSATLYEKESLSAENLERGALRILWGLFKKMIIADRLAVMVSTVFNHYNSYHGVVIAAGAIAYTIQLYMEFSGSMDIVIGSGTMFGITLPENFKQPFFAKNATEFWRRWHITLGVWFKEYIFYPVSISRLVKRWNKFGRKKVGKYFTRVGMSVLALFPVWLCNGLWHGPRWSYLFYGLYYFTIIIFGIMVEPIRKKVVEVCHINTDALWFHMMQSVKLCAIVFTGELFFRAEGFLAGCRMFYQMFQKFQISDMWNGTLLGLGLDNMDFGVILIGCAVVWLVSMIKEQGIEIRKELQRVSLPARWLVYYGLILSVIIFGAYGNGYAPVDLIYAGF